MTKLLMLASMVFASAVFAQVEIPHVHENGDVIDADEINQNLDIVAKAVPPRDCSKDQIIKWNGSAWVCADNNLVVDLSCGQGEGLVYRDGKVDCQCEPPGTAITDNNFNAAIADWFANGSASEYGDISEWCTGAVSDMSNAFRNRSEFNGSIVRWDTSNVTNMKGFLAGATAFNQDIGLWAMGRAENMDEMFFGASAFNHDLSKWRAPLVTSCKQFADGATAWLDAYSGPIAGKTPPLSTSLIAAGCGN